LNCHVQITDRNVDNKAHDDEFLGGNEDSIGNWTK
jgi:hypothetical protein